MHRISSRASVLGLKEDLFPLGRRHVHDRVYCLRKRCVWSCAPCFKVSDPSWKCPFLMEKVQNPQAANPGTPGRWKKQTTEDFLYWERLERGRTLSFKPPKQIFYPQVNCPRVFRAGCGKGNRNIPKRSFKFWKLRSPGCHQDVTRASGVSLIS